MNDLMKFDPLNEIDCHLLELEHMAEFAVELAGNLLEVDEGYFRIPRAEGDRLAFCAGDMLRRVGELRDALPFAPKADAGRALLPVEVLSDLLGSGDFPVEIANPDAAADLIIQRLIDAGFEIKPADGRQP